MKKKLLIVFILSVCSFTTFACDICGSGVGGGYMGLLPGFHKKFISVRYSQNGLLSHVGQNGSYSYLTTKETYRVAEIWGAVNIGQRFRVAAFIPVNFLERKNDTGEFAQSGLGDVNVVGYYQLLSAQPPEGSTGLGQSLWIGAGVKAPTGNYNPEEKSIQNSSQNTFQLGTGSTDFSLNVMYDLRVNNAGLNINASYKKSTRNKYDYLYGNKFTSNLLVYYRFNIKDRIAITPNTGVLYEQSAKDEKVKGVEVWETGGHSMMGTLGVEFSVGRIGAGMNFQTPLSQQLGEGKIRAQDRGMAYVSYSF